MSLLSALLTGSALVTLALARPTPLTGVAVAVLLAVGYAADSADGQLARLRGGGTLRGEWLDHTIDCFKIASLHLVVAISFFRAPPTGDNAVLLVPLAASVVSCGTYFGLILMSFLRQQAYERGAAKPAPLESSAQGSEHPLRKWLILPADYGFLCWTFVLLGTQPLFFYLYASVSLLAAALLALALVKWWRELTELDAAIRQAPRP
ncbi:MAG: CDP-alcohol phosphatidyltransferase family protein [Nocardioidaceae bacterium]